MIRFDTPAPEADVDEGVDVEERVALPWKVLLFNDDVHTFDEVIHQVIKATGCSFQQADDIAMTVHTQGKAVAYEGEFAECFRVQGVLHEIALLTQIEG